MTTPAAGVAHIVVGCGCLCGHELLQRLEFELSTERSRTKTKVIPTTDSSSRHKPLKHFDDLYGYRGSHHSVFWLSPWEFVSLWEVVEKTSALEIKDDEIDRVAYPRVDGEVQLSEHFYMRRRPYPFAVSASNTRMSPSFVYDKQNVQQCVSCDTAYLENVVDFEEHLDP